MGRKPKTSEKRRVQLRLSPRSAAIFDAYSSDELSQIMAIALDTIKPGSKITTVPSVILRPVQVVTESIARIKIDKDLVLIFLPEKIEEFRSLAKKLHYQWIDFAWRRTVEEDVAVERAAEIGYRIMELGIPVQVDCEEVCRKIISGKFQIEPQRVIKVCTSGVYKGWLSFSYPKGEDFYDRIMRITAAKYANGSIRVPIENFAEVEDFAEIEGFVFSEAAQEAVNKARHLIDSAQILEIAPLKERTQKKRNSKKDAGVTAVPDHLKDDTA
ncbi:MAG: hypothetical protein KME11_04690 [Timaviella obliquedivisa GSE-PSE-MK23-08B]|jgi:hypothetical protein|nr:hypothetical protein [Timaviella obliquedivisa GSE-PSE-MK23-08B]